MNGGTHVTLKQQVEVGQVGETRLEIVEGRIVSVEQSPQLWGMRGEHSARERKAASVGSGERGDGREAEPRRRLAQPPQAEQVAEPQPGAFVQVRDHHLSTAKRKKRLTKKLRWNGSMALRLRALEPRWTWVRFVSELLWLSFPVELFLNYKKNFKVHPLS
jgi:hypothetical protein